MRLGVYTLCCVSLLSLSLVADAQDPAQLMSEQDRAAILKLLPQLADPEMNQKLHSPRMLLYTHKEMPPAYQHSRGNGYVSVSVHSPYYNISGDPSDQGGGRDGQAYGNANREFPWSLHPGGAHLSPGVKAFKGLWLPTDERGKLLPVVWFRQDLPGRPGRIVSTGVQLDEGRSHPSGRTINYGYSWCYPTGAILIEGITMQSPDGYTDMCELRVRIKESDAWGVDMFRPYETAQSYADAIKKQWPDWSSDPVRAAAVRQLESPPQAEYRRLADDLHTRERAFEAEAWVEALPQMRPADVSILLRATPWVSCLGGHWRTDPPITAPINLSGPAYNLLPAKYELALLGNDRKGCMQCHSSVLRHATDFQMPRGWYGFVRGAQGAFSLHPFAHSSISYLGTRLPVRMNQDLIRSGVFAAFDQSLHFAEHYSLIDGLH